MTPSQNERAYDVSAGLFVASESRFRPSSTLDRARARPKKRGTIQGRTVPRFRSLANQNAKKRTISPCEGRESNPHELLHQILSLVLTLKSFG